MTSQVTQAQWQATQLAYCSNVHPGESLAEVTSTITKKLNAVRNQRQLTRMASGLWLSNLAINQLHSNNDEHALFSAALQSANIKITSLNGFPYGNFHQKVVKQAVYLPSWAEVERLEYAKQLAQFLAHELDVNYAHTVINHDGTSTPYGAISTLPLGYAKGWTAEHTVKAVDHLLELALFLEQLELKTGKRIVFGIEMEPDCVLESTPQLVRFFQQSLLPHAQQQGVEKARILRYIGCCYDTCHQAVMFENPDDSLTRITNAGINICKIQISNAVEVKLTNELQIETLCALFNDSKFLHQCKLKSANQNDIAIADLTADELKSALKRHQQGQQSHPNKVPLECTIHYHVPIHLSELAAEPALAGALLSTQQAIKDTLDFLQAHPKLMPYLEIETYTWLQMLKQSDSPQAELIDGLTDEFIWLERQLAKRQLLLQY